MKILLSYPDPFNSRPHKEVDDPGPLRRGGLTLSIHDLTRRSTSRGDHICGMSIFQFTTSQGGRPGVHDRLVACRVLSIHDLTRRSTLVGVVSEITRGSFNSRPHKEVDADATLLLPAVKAFNSRPHKEVDSFLSSSAFSDSKLSIHDLTRRATIVAGMFAVKKGFQFTTSQGGRLQCATACTSATAFQFTTSQGGRLAFDSSLSVMFDFQFTTSQGGRLRCHQRQHTGKSFNSRPHKEVDS